MQPLPQTPMKIIMIVVITESVLACIGVLALSLSLFFKTYADPSILTAMIALTSGLIGSLGTILTNTRQSPPSPDSGAPSTTTTEKTEKTVTTVPPQPPPTPAEPQSVKIEQPLDQPVPVMETPPTTS